MSFLGILASNQSTMMRIALHKKVCCWDTALALCCTALPCTCLPAPDQTVILAGGGEGCRAGGGGDQGRHNVSEWPGGWLGPPAARRSAARHSSADTRPQHAPRPQLQSWPGHRDRVSLHQHQWPGSSSRHADHTVIVWAEGRFMFPYVWTIFPWLFLVLYLLFVFIDVWLPSKWPELGGETNPPPLRRLSWRGSESAARARV